MPPVDPALFSTIVFTQWFWLFWIFSSLVVYIYTTVFADLKLVHNISAKNLQSKRLS